MTRIRTLILITACTPLLAAWRPAPNQGAGYQLVEGKAAPQDSYVILFGIDPGAPARAPRRCKKLGTVRFKASTDAVGNAFSAARAAARALGANALSRIKRRDDGYLADALRCRKIVLKLTRARTKQGYPAHISAGSCKSASPPLRDLLKHLKRTGRYTFEVPRRFWRGANITKLLSGKLSAPEMRDGRRVGLRARFIRRCSAYFAVGIRNNDLLVRVAGLSLESHANAMRAQEKLSRVSELRIDLLRSGRPVAVRVRIR